MDKELHRTRWWRYGATMLLPVAAIGVNPGTQDLLHLYRTDSLPVSFLSDPSLATEKPQSLMTPDQANLDQKPNFVYLYLESVERSYLDEAHFPGLMPNLKRLEQQALTFTNIAQAPGTGWTIAGMVASQCGIPLITPPDGGNSMGGLIGNFLPKATCLGDLLKPEGYHLEFIGGAELKFAGKGDFYQSHGFSKVSGFDELSPLLEDKSYRNGWGLYDDTLLEITKQRFNALSKQKQPFGLVALTLDTHHPSGHISNFCQNKLYGNGENSILNSVHCTDEMVGKFIDYLTSHEAFQNTRVIIASDHLAIRNAAWERLMAVKQRRNTFMVLANDLPATRVNRPGTTLDIAPTLLSLLSSPVQAMGFGRNLLNDKIVPIEKETGHSLKQNLENANRYLRSLWHYPDFRNGFTVDLTGR